MLGPLPRKIMGGQPLISPGCLKPMVLGYPNEEVVFGH